jgi:hypothetical protein
VSPRRAASLLLACGLVAAAATGCGTAPRRAEAAPSASRAAAPTPDEAEDLGDILVATVPSGLPRMPDAGLVPPAGEKTLDDVAGYADDPAHERTVLRDFGFRFGWERFWGTRDGPVTSVFLDQFAGRAGAAEFAGDLAGNDAAHYRAVLHERPEGLPAGCRLLTVAQAEPDVGLRGPAAFAWCAHGVFSVAVTSVSSTPDAARAEVAAVVAAQLARLPG